MQEAGDSDDREEQQLLPGLVEPFLDYGLAEEAGQLSGTGGEIAALGEVAVSRTLDQLQQLTDEVVTWVTHPVPGARTAT
ncbi:hypothetical protein [Streptomyces sp. NPDC127066]|uniref:hypothetical protein n=1 Tax=Streptomyces sp. NPDC127066 TaxID=3347125 RepID=UPI0036547210